jgi:hypothetical protein
MRRSRKLRQGAAFPGCAAVPPQHRYGVHVRGAARGVRMWSEESTATVYLRTRGSPLSNLKVGMSVAACGNSRSVKAGGVPLATAVAPEYSA